MTERGHPTEGAPACPFVAFEDDRDARSTVPDHRHRCFAEARPAPRALAHQEAYCLSSAFPVCPTFQDWARREAAAAKPQPAASAVPREEPPESRPMPPLDREPLHASSDVPPAVPPRRNAPRDWAAPPPWTGDNGSVDPGLAGAAAAGAAGAAGAAAASSGGYGSHEDPYAQDDVPVPSRPRPPADDLGSEARGLAGSAAYRLAGPDPDEPNAATPQGDPYDPYAPATDGSDEPDDEDSWSPAGPAAAAAASTAWAAPSPSRSTPPPGRSAPPPGRGTPPQGTRPPQASKPQPASQDASELFGPAWERPRRYEAYPTLRTRMGLPSFGGVSRLAIAGLALVLAALFLFFFGPMILGFGKQDPGGVAGPTPTPSSEATATPEPTAVPAPTPQVYTVAKGDTMSKIAKKFGVTVEALLAANPQIKNPDKIKIGDKITIPVPVEDGATEP